MQKKGPRKEGLWIFTPVSPRPRVDHLEFRDKPCVPESTIDSEWRRQGFVDTQNFCYKVTIVVRLDIKDIFSAYGQADVIIEIKSTLNIDKHFGAIADRFRSVGCCQLTARISPTTVKVEADVAAKATSGLIVKSQCRAVVGYLVFEIVDIRDAYLILLHALDIVAVEIAPQISQERATANIEARYD